MKQSFDERQKQTLEHIGSNGFYVIFLALTAAILIQLGFFSTPLKNILGETVALLIGGFVYLGSCIKNGLWNPAKSAGSWQNNLIVSLVCSGIFSVFYGLSISQKAGANAPVGKYVCLFFTGIFLLGFLVTTLLSLGAKKREQKQERKYSD